MRMYCKFVKASALSERTQKIYLNFVSYYIKPGQSVLEIGAGNGHLAEILTTGQNLDYQIFDLNDDREVAKNLPLSIVDVAHAPWPLADKSVDIVITAQVIEHLEDISHFFREAHRVLKEDGVLLIKYPNFASFFQRVYFFVLGVPNRLGGAINSGGHINFLPYKFLTRFVAKYFSVDHLRGDQLVDILLTPRLTGNSQGPTFTIMPGITSPNWSYNIMVAFRNKKM